MFEAARSFTDPPGLYHSALQQLDAGQIANDPLQAQQGSVPDEFEGCAASRNGMIHARLCFRTDARSVRRIRDFRSFCKGPVA